MITMRFRGISPKIGAVTIFLCVSLLVVWSSKQNLKPHKQKVDKFEKELLDRFYAQNENEASRMKIRQNGEFWILENYITASKKFAYLESITYTTHGEFTFLDNLEELVKRWQGPISIAVFAPKSDFIRTLRSIDYLRRCADERYLIQTLVSFHVYFPFAHMPAFIPRKQEEFNQFLVNCNETSPIIAEASKSYRHEKSILYPINVGRNIARQLATTHFIFPCDIEIYPNINFIEEFLDLVSRKPEFLFAKPIFEVEKTEDVPNTKTDLQQMLLKGKAIPFHRDICMSCHAIPHIETWIAEKESAQLDIFSTVKHRLGWESFYVTTNSEPLYDERYTWEGQYDKEIQAYLLGIMNYDFCILNNAFLVHRPGIKKHAITGTFEINKMKNTTANEVVPQLKILFG